jgi:hypothetical protein
MSSHESAAPRFQRAKALRAGRTAELRADAAGIRVGAAIHIDDLAPEPGHIVVSATVILGFSISRDKPPRQSTIDLCEPEKSPSVLTTGDTPSNTARHRRPRPHQTDQRKRPTPAQRGTARHPDPLPLNQRVRGQGNPGRAQRVERNAIPQLWLTTARDGVEEP